MREMKNNISIFLIMILAMTLFVACGKSEEKRQEEAQVEGLTELGFTQEEAQEILATVNEEVEPVKEEVEEVIVDQDAVLEEMYYQNPQEYFKLLFSNCECQISDKDPVYDMDIQVFDMVFTPGMSYDQVMETIEGSRYKWLMSVEDGIGPYSSTDHFELKSNDFSTLDGGFSFEFWVRGKEEDVVLKDKFLICVMPGFESSYYVWLPGGVCVDDEMWTYDKVKEWNEREMPYDNSKDNPIIGYYIDDVLYAVRYPKFEIDSVTGKPSSLQLYAYSNICHYDDYDNYYYKPFDEKYLANIRHYSTEK